MAGRLDGRNGSIYRAYLLGSTQEALAERHGISQQRVGQIIKEVQAQIPKPDLDEERRKYLDGLDSLAEMAAEIALMPPAPAYSNGRPVLDENGRQVMDHGGRLAAMDRLVKIGERRAKVLGLDAPVAVDMNVTEQARQAEAQAAAEALARLHGDTED